MAEPAVRDRDRAEVVTLGECLVALVGAELGPLAEVGAFGRHVAGAEANVAVGLARLGHRAAFIGRVGADGHLFRERRALGAAEVVYARAGSAGSRLGPEDVDAAAAGGAFDGARWLHLTGITPALSASCRAAVERTVDQARERRMTISLDLNLRRKLWSVEEAGPALAALAARCDVVLGDADEAAIVTGNGESGGQPSANPELLDALLALGPALAVIKLGASGATARARDGEAVSRPGLAVTPVDPVGAGDAFCAGFIAARLEGADLAQALDAGNACGAAAVAAIGDQAGLPDAVELGRLLAGSPRDTIR